MSDLLDALRLKQIEANASIQVGVLWQSKADKTVFAIPKFVSFDGNEVNPDASITYSPNEYRSVKLTIPLASFLRDFKRFVPVAAQ